MIFSGINQKKFSLLILFHFILSFHVFACYQDSLKLWKNVKQSKIKSIGQPTIHAKKISVLKLNHSKLDKIFIKDSSATSWLLTLPKPDGKAYRTFVVEKSHVLAPELEKKFPEIKSYSGYDKIEKNITLRLDINPTGLHAMITSPEGQYFIEPFNKDTHVYYIVFFKEDVEKSYDSPYSNPDVVK